MAAALPTAVVVDDDPDVRHMLVQVFEAAGFSTVAVGSGSEGVRAVLSMKPLIVSLDVTMPGVDGIEATRLIRAAGADTHIIMITASRDETDVVLGLSAGADEYVYKPLRVRELRARIDAVLRRTKDALANLGGGNASAPVVEPPAPRTTHVEWVSEPQPQPAPPLAEPVTWPAAPVWPTAPAATPATVPATPVPAAPVWAPETAAPRPTHIEFGSATPEWAPAPEYAPAPYGHANSLAQQAPEPEPVTEPPAPGIPAFLVHVDLIVDPSRRIVQLGDRSISLDDVELMLLITLMQSKRLTRSKAELAIVLRGGPTTPKPRIPAHEKAVIDNHIASLRRKLGDDGAKARYIEPVEPIGYRMVTES